MASPRMRRVRIRSSPPSIDLTKTVTAFADFSYYKAELHHGPPAPRAQRPDERQARRPGDRQSLQSLRLPFLQPTGAPNADGTAAPHRCPAHRQHRFRHAAGSRRRNGLHAQTSCAPPAASRASSATRGIGNPPASTIASKAKTSRYPDVRESLLAQALARTDANAYNPFGYTFKVQNGAVVADRPYTNPAAVVDSFSAIYAREATSSIASGDLRVSGRCCRWWGGDI
jgi:iron complex outermembrane receptor protein